MQQAIDCARPDRVAGLDVLRGIAVASMIAAISPGRWEHAVPQLTHAAWVGTPFADFIFPAFLCAVGAAMSFAYPRRIERGFSMRQLLLYSVRRCLLLIGLGLLLNLYDQRSLAELRLPGVLQRIGVCSLFAALVYVPCLRLFPGGSRHDRQARLGLLCTAIVVLLALYYCLLHAVPVPGFGAGRLDSYGSLPAWLDRRVFTVAHLWPYGVTPGVGVTFDPEGLLSSIPALATLLMGTVAGELLRWPASLARRTQFVGLAGVVFLVLGFLLQPATPFIKKIWTPSFACLSGGAALLALAALLWAIDVRGWRRWSLPFRVFGANAILAFSLSWIVMVECGRLRAGGLRWNVWLYDHLFAAWIPEPQLASLANALAFVLLNLLLLVPFHRRQWFLRL